MLWEESLRGGENGRDGKDRMRAFRTYIRIIKFDLTLPLQLLQLLLQLHCTVIATITRSQFLLAHRSVSHAPASDLPSLAPSVLEFV
jgi:hypothetical protein